MNHTETVFLRRRPNSAPNAFSIRFYTPFTEEPFCGHGILGAAHALYAAGQGTEFDFRTFSGIQTSASIIPSKPNCSSCSNFQDEGKVQVSLSFPSSPILPSLAPSSDLQTAFAKALSVGPEKILAIGQNELMDIIIELEPGLDFSYSNMKIDPVKLLNASPEGTRSQVLTSSWNMDEEVDFAKRVFAYGCEGKNPLHFASSYILDPYSSF